MMQRPSPIVNSSRFTPPRPRLPSPPESDTKSPCDFDLHPPVSSSRPMAAPKSSRRVSSAIRAEKAVHDDAKSFVLESNASQEKYMHHFKRLTENLDVKGPTCSEHQVKQDPTGKLRTHEYILPQKLWPPAKENAKSTDNSLKIRWGRDNGYVQITNIQKALKMSNIKMSEFLKGYEEHIVRIRGGQIEVQGSWIPFDIARKVCLEKCYSIRKYLAPIFGPEFVEECMPVNVEDEPIRRRAGRRPKSPPAAVKRTFDESLDEEDEDEEPTPRQEPKRRTLTNIGSGLAVPPPLPHNLTMHDSLEREEICAMLSAARELMRMQRCPYHGPPQNDWPMPGDPRMGGYVYHQGRRLKWNGENELKGKASTPRTPLPSLAQVIQPVTPPHIAAQQYTRFPITPSPHHSPFVPSSMEWQSPFSTAAGRTLISPPMSVGESFNGFSRERQSSFNNADECHTPARHYTGSLFPTPQPDDEA